MFQRRLMVFIAVLVLLMVTLLSRLAWLQWIRTDYYQEKTRVAFEKPPRWLETVRGNIYDIKGRALATVEARYQLCLHYNLTRLYDQRFWEIQTLRAGKKKSNRNKSREQLERNLYDHYHGDLELADQILDELVELCHISRQEFQESIRRINDRLFDRQMVRARKIYYRRHGMKYVSHSTMQAIRDDFFRLIPDDQKRLSAISQAGIWEMTQPQPALPHISREIALAVEDFFGQTRLGNVVPVVVLPKKLRKYPYRDVACHLIGHLGPVEVSELSDSIPPEPQDYQAYFSFDRCGAQGVEYMFESLLRGRRGWEHKHRSGNNLEEPTSPVMGSDVRLTLDIELQKDVQQLFEERSDNGAAVIIDVASGAVLAMVSVPTYDLNTYYQHDFYSVINDEDDPLHRKWNRALSVNYQPGSTIKPIVLLGALELDVVQALEQFNCHPRFKDWVGVPSDIHKHGLFDAADAIRQSCNFYFIKVGEKLGPQRMTDWLGRTGRDRRILAWPQAFSDRAIKGFGETLGHIKPIGATSLRTADLRFVAIGRGSLDGSLLQVANSTAAIARHGLYVAPTLIASPLVSQERIPIASQHYSRIVEKAMAEVVADSRGSGYEAFQPPLWEADDVRVYGKTGSTNYSLFTCYAKSQVSQQCIAVAVLVEVDLLGGEAAAPLARRILKKAAQHDYLPETLNYINGGG